MLPLFPTCSSSGIKLQNGPLLLRFTGFRTAGDTCSPRLSPCRPIGFQILPLQLGSTQAKTTLLQPALQGAATSIHRISSLIFPPAQMQVPYSPHLPELFFGEEMIMAVRLFTHGWDVYAPPEALVFHQWSREHRPFFRESRKPDLEARAASEWQVKSFLCTERREGEEVCGVCSAPPAESYGREYGLGDLRSVRSFAEACSVNFCWKRIGRKTKEQFALTERPEPC